MVVGAGWRGDARVSVVCGGERFPADVLGPLVPHCRRVVNAYGPTEATIWATAHVVHCASEDDDDDDDDDDTLHAPPLTTSAPFALPFAAASAAGATKSPRFEVPIGRPLPYEGCACAVVVAAVNGGGWALAADGDEGELWIGGPAVAKGYLGGGAATDRFVAAAPWLPPATAAAAAAALGNGDGGNRSASRWYRTGDLVRRDTASEDLYFLGRCDDAQVPHMVLDRALTTFCAWLFIYPGCVFISGAADKSVLRHEIVCLRFYFKV
jgi:acyl-CoA synthetase (AMP-forming)/AMP-acid ligase II